MSPGSYIAPFSWRQFSILAFGQVVQMKDDRDRNRKGDGWLIGILGFYFAAMFPASSWHLYSFHSGRGQPDANQFKNSKYQPRALQD